MDIDEAPSAREVEPSSFSRFVFKNGIRVPCSTQEWHWAHLTELGLEIFTPMFYPEPNMFGKTKVAFTVIKSYPPKVVVASAPDEKYFRILTAHLAAYALDQLSYRPSAQEHVAYNEVLEKFIHHSLL